MKKKLFYILLILIISFSFINNVFADGLIVSATTENNEIPMGGEATIMVNLQSSEIIGECFFEIEEDSNLEFVSVFSANGWTALFGTKGISLSGPDSQKNVLANGLNVFGLKYKVNGDGRVVIKTSQCASFDEKTYDYPDVPVNFTVKEEVDDTTLSDLTVTNGAVTKNGTQYIINLTSTSFGLDITATNPEYQDDIVVKDKDDNVITDINNMTFDDPTGQGLMSLTITVNNETVYDVLVKYEKKEYDNTLKSLTINDEELQLEDGQYTYVYSVSKDIKDVEIKPVLNDSENFELSGNYSGKHSFSDNVIYVVVEVVPKDSTSGAKKVTYNIEIQKEGTTNNDDNAGNGSSTVTPGNNSGNNSSNVNNNPTTRDMPMVLMAFVLVVSLLGSVLLYQKNIQGYK